MAKRFTKFFAVPVNENLVIETEFGLTRGLPVPFVVRLMAEIDGCSVCVSRFDSAHLSEPPHRDVLGLRAGLLCKEFYDELDYSDAVRYAIADFKKHGPEYYDYFLRH